MDDIENVSIASSNNQLNNNPFSELSNESFHKLDEVLNSEPVKQLLSDSKNLDQLAASILETQTTSTLSSSSLSSTVNSNLLINSSTAIAPGHVATVQEGLDLVDALDSLVNQLTSSQPPTHHYHQQQQQQQNLHQFHHQSHEIEMLGENLEVNSSFDFFIDSVYLDHNYACVPVKQQFVAKEKDLSLKSEIEANNSTTNISIITTSTPNNFNNNSNNSQVNISSSQSSPSSTPARRSQRQIERIEKSVLEKIKAENQEMLKREREEMEAQKIEKNLEAKRKSLDLELDSSLHSKAENGEDDDKDESLIIDFDNKRKINKKRGRKKTKTSLEGDSSVKSKIDDTYKESKENLDKIVDENNLESKNFSSSSQRSQRQRRKPKRWDDDEVEVDFSGTALELGNEINSQSINKHAIVKKDFETNVKKIKTSDEENEVDDSEENESDDDPDKLWCICRQPHNNRFMISCDGCEDWFHGKCVGVTRAMGRVYEKEGKKWYCMKCKQSKEPTLKLENKLESSESKPLENVTLIKKLDKSKLEDKKDSLVKKLKNENKMKFGSILKTKVKGKSFRSQMSAEKKEAFRLKKLIKSTKLELKKTLDDNKKDSSKELGCKDDSDKTINKWEPISRVVPLIRKSEEKKKKLKHLPIDPSFNDLFKAESIVMPKKVSTTSLTSPTTPSYSSPSSSSNQTFLLKRSSSLLTDSPHTYKKKALPTGSVLSNDSNCLTCGKVIKKGAIRGKETSIYCAETCIQKHFKDSLELIKLTRASNSGVIINKGERIKVNLIEKSSRKLMSGSNAIYEDKVLEFLKSNPTFEILKPNAIKKHSNTGNYFTDHEKRKDGNKSTLQQNKKNASKKKEELQKLRSTETVIKSSSKSEEPTSETVRLSVKKALKEALWTRCQEADSKFLTDDIKKIAYKIEEELFNYFNKDISSKYKNRYRSLVFNLRDQKNQGLFRKVVSGSISPERLVKMSPEELASAELAKWRERENKHAIEMIKRDAEQMSQQVIVKKTHKGEELIETITPLEAIAVAKVEEGVNKNETTDSPTLLSSFNPSIPSKEKLTASDLDSNRDGKSSSLDEKRKEEDSTEKHGQHLYDLHCKICTKRTKQDLSLTHRTKSIGSSPTRSSHEIKVSQPKRVRVEFDEPTNKIIEEAAKLSRSAKESKLSDFHFQETSKEGQASFTDSPEQGSNSSSKAKSSSCWKGFIYMQDVAKFVASAYKVSGVVESQVKDVPDTVTVCGRIAPEQVLDYLKKLKYSTRTEISIIRFSPANHEEKVGYDAFFNYLNNRNRYGVVGGTGKTIKDFYILPLPKESDSPEVLLPFDGPGLDKSSHRNNLLLGILVKNKKHQLKASTKEKQSISDSNKLVTENTSSISREQPERSYTPPPPLSSKNDFNSEDPYDPGLSLTPPIRDQDQLSSVTCVKPLDESEEPYDPEENDLNIPKSSSEPSIQVSDLLDQLSKSNNPVEMTSTFLGSVAKNATIEEQKWLLEELTKKVEDSKRQLEEQRKAAEAAFTIASKSIDIINKSESTIPGLDGSYPSNDSNRSSLLESLQIPENLKEILESVKHKAGHEQNQESDKIKGLSFDDPIVRDFGQETLDEDEEVEEDEIKSDLVSGHRLEDDEKKIPEPMEIEEEEEGVEKRDTIIEVNNTKARVDPRLRSKKQQPLSSSNLVTGDDDKSVSQLKDEELIMKAHLQLEALKRMEMQQQRLEEAHKQAYKALGSMSVLAEPVATSSPSLASSQSASAPSSSSPPPPPKLKIEWKKTCKSITKS